MARKPPERFNSTFLFPRQFVCSWLGQCCSIVMSLEEEGLLFHFGLCARAGSGQSARCQSIRRENQRVTLSAVESLLNSHLWPSWFCSGPIPLPEGPPLLLSVLILATFFKSCPTLKLLVLWRCPLLDWTARLGPFRNFQTFPVPSADVQDSDLGSGYFLICKALRQQRRGRPCLAHRSSSRPSLCSLASFVIFYIEKILIDFPQIH